VVLDLLLPGIHGEAFLRWLRQPGRVRVPVVVVTVEHLDEAARRALADLWVAAVLQKGPGVAPAAAGAVARLLRTEDAAAATAAGAQEPVLEMGEAAYRGWPH
jgi:CheY-like chemotaxis protein